MEVESFHLQVLEEIKALHVKAGRLLHNNEQEWGRLSIIIQQDRQARVCLPDK